MRLAALEMIVKSLKLHYLFFILFLLFPDWGVFCSETNVHNIDFVDIVGSNKADPVSNCGRVDYPYKIF
jgi:hypothetical protein